MELTAVKAKASMVAMHRQIQISLPGTPFAQPRTRVAVVGGRPRVYQTAKSGQWRAWAQEHILDHLTTIDADTPVFAAGLPLGLEIYAIFPLAKTAYRKTSPIPEKWRTKKPDADNITKAIKDACNGILWIDDSQVVREICEKRTAAQARPPYVLIRVGIMLEQPGSLRS